MMPESTGLQCVRRSAVFFVTGPFLLEAGKVLSMFCALLALCMRPYAASRHAGYDMGASALQGPNNPDRPVG